MFEGKNFEEIFECLKEKNLMKGGIKEIIENVNNKFISELEKIELPKDLKKYVKKFEYDERKLEKCMENNIKKCKELAKAFSKVKNKDFQFNKAEKRLSKLIKAFEIEKNKLKIDAKAKIDKGEKFSKGILDCAKEFEKIDIRKQEFSSLEGALENLETFLKGEFDKRKNKKSDSKYKLDSIIRATQFCISNTAYIINNNMSILTFVEHPVKSLYSALDEAINFKDKKPLLRKLSPDSTPVLAYGSVKEAFRVLKDKMKKAGLNLKDAEMADKIAEFEKDVSKYIEQIVSESKNFKIDGEVIRLQEDDFIKSIIYFGHTLDNYIKILDKFNSEDGAVIKKLQCQSDNLSIVLLSIKSKNFGIIKEEQLNSFYKALDKAINFEYKVIDPKGKLKKEFLNLKNCLQKVGLTSENLKKLAENES